jgi:hypothetical protein
MLVFYNVSYGSPDQRRIGKALGCLLWQPTNIASLILANRGASACYAANVRSSTHHRRDSRRLCALQMKVPEAVGMNALFFATVVEIVEKLTRLLT